jgi:hypothetical protein
MRTSATTLLEEVGFFTLMGTAPPPLVVNDVDESSRETFASRLPVAA